MNGRSSNHSAREPLPEVRPDQQYASATGSVPVALGILLAVGVLGAPVHGGGRVPGDPDGTRVAQHLLRVAPPTPWTSSSRALPVCSGTGWRAGAGRQEPRGNSFSGAALRGAAERGRGGATDGPGGGEAAGPPGATIPGPGRRCGRSHGISPGDTPDMPAWQDERGPQTAADGTAEGRTGPGVERESEPARGAAPCADPRRGAQAWRGPGQRADPQAERLRHDDPPGSGRAGPPGRHREGPRRCGPGRGGEYARARVRGEVGAGAERQGGHRAGGGGAGGARQRHRALGRDDDLRAGPASAGRAGSDGGDQLGAGGRRVP